MNELKYYKCPNKLAIVKAFRNDTDLEDIVFDGLCDVECEGMNLCSLWLIASMASAPENRMPTKQHTLELNYRGGKGFKDWINVRCELNKISLDLKTIIQKAHDAFWQEDYETAIIHYQIALQRNVYSEVVIGLAVANFLLDKYEEAIQFAVLYIEYISAEIRIKDFIELCSIYERNKTPLSEEALNETIDYIENCNGSFAMRLINSCQDSNNSKPRPGKDNG